MTQTQEKLLYEIKDRLEDNKKRSTDLPEDCDWYWVAQARRNQVLIKANSRTLESLEHAGLIKIINHAVGIVEVL